MFVIFLVIGYIVLCSFSLDHESSLSTNNNNDENSCEDESAKVARDKEAAESSHRAPVFFVARTDGNNIEGHTLFAFVHGLAMTQPDWNLSLREFKGEAGEHGKLLTRLHADTLVGLTPVYFNIRNFYSLAQQFKTNEKLRHRYAPHFVFLPTANVAEMSSLLGSLQQQQAADGDHQPSLSNVLFITDDENLKQPQHQQQQQVGEHEEEDSGGEPEAAAVATAVRTKAKRAVHQVQYHTTTLLEFIVSRNKKDQ